MNILVPVSGGKDSAASLVLAKNQFPEANIKAVFNDTGWEHPLTYEYLDYLSDRMDINIERTVGGLKNGKECKTLPELIREQGRFPFGQGRFCTMYLKQYALRDYYKQYIYDGETQWEFWFGMRQDESVQRGKKYAGMTYDDLYDMGDLFPNRYNQQLRKTIQVRLPVVEWTTRQVFKYLSDHNVKYNELYSEGTNDRVGCYPCLLAGKKVQAKMFATKFGQQRLQEIRELEQAIGKKYEMFDLDQGSCEICNI